MATSKQLAYTLNELMVAAAAREIKDSEVVFVGMRLPLIAFVVAKKTHAPNAIGLFENGVIRSTPSAELIYKSGRVNLGFLGAAEVDKYGNLNSTQVQGKNGMVRLPGSGGACDIASMAQRFVSLLEHGKHRLPEKVSYITSPGNGEGAGWRKRVGLPRGGPSAVITTKCVLRFGDDAEAYLSTYHRGVRVDDVLANTGWKLKVAPDAKPTPEPSAAELKAIREYDTKGFWTS